MAFEASTDEEGHFSAARQTNQDSSSKFAPRMDLLKLSPSHHFGHTSMASTKVLRKLLLY